MRPRTSKVLAATAASVLTAGVLTTTALAVSGRAAPTSISACERTTTKAIADLSGNAALRCPAGYTKVSWVSGAAPGVPDLFGNGSSGSATIAGTVTLTSDKYYNNLTIDAGATLATNGFRVFVAGTLTFVGRSTIEDNGGAATPGGGPGAPAGTLGGGQIGAFEFANGPFTNSLGGSGGTGVETGAAPAVKPVASAGGSQVFASAEGAITGRGPDGQLVNGGAGGGDDCEGGGGGAGVIVVVAQSIVHTGTGQGVIQAVGGSGYEGGCGGGGGGGGVVVVVSPTSMAGVNVVLSVPGGAGDESNPGYPGFAEWL